MTNSTSTDMLRERFLFTLAIVATLLPCQITPAGVQVNAIIETSTQTQALAYDEAQTVYLGNLARRDNGVAPLRWNAQLTDAARWFSWDSTENRPDGFCGHQDTQNNWPDYRARAFGYIGSAGAENVFCGFLNPQDAIDGWMNSPDHRANLLDPNSREIGLGYYQRASDGHDYVTQDFGHDPAYAPVIIENEAINVTSPNVNLYIYDREAGGGFAGLAPTSQMLVGNDTCFSGAAWEPYTADKAWSLTSGAGWRTVYVKTRDAFNRTMTVSDAVYLGATVPLDEIGAAQMSATQSQVTLYGLNGSGLPQAQFSLGWLADDTFGSYGGLWGEVSQVSDAEAWGGTASRLGPNPQGGETSSWVWDTTFIKDAPLVAYVRLKVDDNTSPNEVARFSATGGGTLSLKGTDFSAPNQYQEFPLPFTFPDNETFLIFQFWRSGATDVYVDAVSIFTAPQAFTSPLTWAVPGGNYRGQGVQVRYTDGGSQFSPIIEASTTPPVLRAALASVTVFAERNGSHPPPPVVTVSQNCESVSWQVNDDANWLTPQINGDSVQLNINPSGLSNGTHTATLTISAVGNPDVPSVAVPITLVVVDQVTTIYLPLVRR